MRTREDWSLLDTVSIRLKCNEYNVAATGKKDIMIDRLIEKFRFDDAQQTPPPASPVQEENEDEIALTIDQVTQNDFLEFQDGASGTTNKSKRTKSGKQPQAPKNKDGARNKQRVENKQPTAKRSRTSSPAKTTSKRNLPGSSAPLANTSDDQTQTNQQPRLSAIDEKMDLIMQAIHSTQNDINILQSHQATFEENIEQRLSTGKRSVPPEDDSPTIPAKKSNTSTNSDNNNNNNNVNIVSQAGQLGAALPTGDTAGVNTGTFSSAPLSQAFPHH